VHGFTDSFFPHRHAVEITECVESLKRFEPTVIFTHRRHDLHQDHRFLCELTWNTFRDHLVLEYEVPKYDGDLGTGGSPNFFVPVDRGTLEEKSRLIRKHFLSQSAKHWFDEEVFTGLARVRGVECRSPTGYAEAFDARKIVV
jgi:LmbE family N-acetylglucosaminyl deacetylase